MDTMWSETGDRYMLKLFRDYLFHQVDENGAPWMDMAHIVQCLNKVLLSVICSVIWLWSKGEKMQAYTVMQVPNPSSEG